MEVMNSQPFHTPSNENPPKNGYPTPTFSKVIGRKLSNNPSADIYLRCQMNFTRDAIINKSPNFMNLGLSAVNTSNELRPFSILTIRTGSPIDGSNCLPPGYLIGEVTAARMIRTRS